MEINLLKAKRKTIITIVAAFLILGVGFSLLNKFKYDAVTKVLVYQKFPSGTDIYSINRSNEYLSSVLAEIVSSDSFYDEVIRSGFNIDEKYFSGENNSNDAIKKWTEAVSARPAVDSGIIEITAFHPDRYQAEQIARAVNFILVTKNQNYHGGGENVVIKVIDKPVVSNWPVKPNLPLNIGLALMAGLALSLTYVYLFPEKKYDLSFWPRRKEGSKRYGAEISGVPIEKDNWHSLGNILDSRKETGMPASRGEQAFSAADKAKFDMPDNQAHFSNIISPGINEEYNNQHVPDPEVILSKGRMENLRV